MSCCLLVAHQYVLNLALSEDGILNVQCRTSGVAEDVLNALVLKGANEHISPREEFRHVGHLQCQVFLQKSRIFCIALKREWRVASAGRCMSASCRGPLTPLMAQT